MCLETALNPLVHHTHLVLPGTCAASRALTYSHNEPSGLHALTVMVACDAILGRSLSGMIVAAVHGVAVQALTLDAVPPSSRDTTHRPHPITRVHRPPNALAHAISVESHSPPPSLPPPWFMLHLNHPSQEPSGPVGARPRVRTLVHYRHPKVRPSSTTPRPTVQDVY